MEIIGYFLFAVVGIVVLLYGLSFTEFGPFTQLPNNRYLRVKRGNRIADYYINSENLAINSKGQVTKSPNDTYRENLKKNPFFSILGMVWTGIPWIGGVEGKKVAESRLKFSQNPDGSIECKVVEEGPTYYTAPPVFMNHAIVLGGIPIEGKNLVNFAVSMTLQVEHAERYDTKLRDGNRPIKHSFESALRPEVEKLSFDDVLKIKTEVKNEDGVAKKIIDRTNTNMGPEENGGYEYGVMIYDLDMPIIEAADQEYGKAVRAKQLAQAAVEAKEVELAFQVKEIRDKGKVVADAHKAFVDANGNNPLAFLADGMKGVKPGASVVIGGGVMPTFDINQQPKKEEKK